MKSPLYTIPFAPNRQFLLFPSFPSNHSFRSCFSFSSSSFSAFHSFRLFFSCFSYLFIIFKQNICVVTLLFHRLLKRRQSFSAPSTKEKKSKRTEKNANFLSFLIFWCASTNDSVLSPNDSVHFIRFKKRRTKMTRKYIWVGP